MSKSSIIHGTGFAMISLFGSPWADDTDRIFSLDSIKLDGLKPEPVFFEALGGNPVDVFAGKFNPVLTLEGKDISAEMLSDAAGVGNVRYPANPNPIFIAFNILGTARGDSLAVTINNATPAFGARSGNYLATQYASVSQILYSRMDANTGNMESVVASGIFSTPPVLASGTNDVNVAFCLIGPRLGYSTYSLKDTSRQKTCSIFVAMDAYRENSNMMFIGWTRSAVLNELGHEFTAHELMTNSPEFTILGGDWTSRWIKTTNSRG